MSNDKNSVYAWCVRIYLYTSKSKKKWPWQNDEENEEIVNNTWQAEENLYVQFIWYVRVHVKLYKHIAYEFWNAPTYVKSGWERERENEMGNTQSRRLSSQSIIRSIETVISLSAQNLRALYSRMIVK